MTGGRDPSQMQDGGLVARKTKARHLFISHPLGPIRMITTSTVENVERSWSSYTPVGMSNGASTLDDILAIPQKVKHRAVNSMATIPLLGIYPRKMKMYVYTKMCMFTTSSIIHNSQSVKITKWPSVIKHIHEMWYIHTVSISHQ